MDNNTPITTDENNGSKSTVLILFVIVAVICLLTICGAVGVFYIYRNVIPSLDVTEPEVSIPEESDESTYEFFDDFSDNSNQWTVGRDTNEYFSGDFVVQDGAYVWEFKEFHQDLFVSSWRTYIESPVVQDFDLTVDAKLLTPQSDKLCYAVVFHADPGEFSTNGYEFHVCDTGQFFVGYYTADESKNKEFIQWTDASAIRSGDWNTLAVSARGDEYTLSINDEIVFQIVDTSSPSGRVYLLARYYESKSGTVAFDNFGFQSR